MGKALISENKTCLEQTPLHKNATHHSVACFRLWIMGKMTADRSCSRATELSAADWVLERVTGSKLERFNFQQHFSVAVTLQFSGGMEKRTKKHTEIQNVKWNNSNRIVSTIHYMEEGGGVYYMKTGGGTMTWQRDKACTEIIHFSKCWRRSPHIWERDGSIKRRWRTRWGLAGIRRQAHTQRELRTDRTGRAEGGWNHGSVTKLPLKSTHAEKNQIFPREAATQRGHADPDTLDRPASQSRRIFLKMMHLKTHFTVLCSSF